MQNKVFLIGIVAGLAAALGLAAAFSAMAAQASAQSAHSGHGAMGTGMAMNQSTTAAAGQSQPNSGMFGASASSMVRNVSVTGVTITGDKQVSVSLRHTGTGAGPSVVVVAITNPSAVMPMMHNAIMGMGSSMGGGTSQGMMMGHGSTGGGMGMGGGMGGMSHGGTAATNAATPAWNSTQWQQWHAQMAQLAGQQQDPALASQFQQWHAQMMQNPAMMAPGSMMWNATSGALAGPQQQLQQHQQHSAQAQTGSAVVNAGWQHSTVRVKLDGAGSAYDSGIVGVLVFPLSS